MKTFFSWVVYYGLIKPLSFLNRKPILIKTHSFHIVYFGLFASLGIMASLSVFFFYLYARGCFNGLSPVSMAVTIVLGHMIGVKAFHALSLGKKFLADPGNYLNETTMYNQGGVFGILIAVVALALIKNISSLLMLDAIVLGSSLGLFFGRLGCYNYGCCFGIPTQGGIHVTYDLSCSKIIRTNPELKGIPLVPTQLLTAYFDLFLFILFIIIVLNHPGDGWITLTFIVLFNLFRIFIQQFRFKEKSDLLNFSKIAFFYFFIGLFLWISLFLFNGGGLPAHPFQVPFTPKEWAHFHLENPRVLLSLVITGVMAFLFYGVHGKILGNHTNFSS